MRPLDPLVAARVKTVDSKAGMSGRLGETGIRWMVPGRRTMPCGRGMMGRVAECDGAMMITWAESSSRSSRELYLGGRHREVGD